jgi:hypothetical protein
VGVVCGEGDLRVCGAGKEVKRGIIEDLNSIYELRLEKLRTLIVGCCTKIFYSVP